MFKTIKFSLLTAVSCCFIMSQAYAGFQFTPPVEKYEQPNITMSGGKNELLPIMQPAPIAPVAQQPMQIAPSKNTGMMSLAPIKAPSQPQAPLSGEFDVAVGFGKDLPLVTALRQIIPSNYTYVLGRDIPVGQTVSWSGGRKWPTVLNDMITPYGMNADIQGGIVTISLSKTLPVVKEYKETAPLVPEVMVTNAMPQQITPNYTSQVSQVTSPPRPPIVQDQTNPSTLPIISNEEKKTATQVPMPSKGQWMARSGDSLRNVLEAWSDIASVDLFWSSDYDYPLMGDVNISGNFKEAIEQLLSGFSQAKPKPIGILHPNLPHGPAVLVVETRQTIN